MATKKAFFKVVLLSGGKMVSTVARGAARREYCIGKATKPIRGTGILVFGTMKDARRFMDWESKDGTPMAILQGTGRQIHLGGSTYSDNPKDIVRAWKYNKQQAALFLFPGGTVALRSFTPKQRLGDWEKILAAAKMEAVASFGGS